jgi:predicted O-methyltransferase YrrM
MSTITKRVDLGMLVPKAGTVVELGVAKGRFSSSLLSRWPQIGRLYAVDKWNDDRHARSEVGEALANLQDGRVSILIMTFEEAAALVSGTQFDLVYVDGYAHTGQDDGQTLDLWWPLVKRGGVFAGHDYDRAWPLTVKSVDRFCAKNGLVTNVIREKPYGSWWVQKA